MVRLLIWHNYDQNKTMFHFYRLIGLKHRIGDKNQLGYVLIKIIE